MFKKNYSYMQRITYIGECPNFNISEVNADIYTVTYAYNV